MSSYRLRILGRPVLETPSGPVRHRGRLAQALLYYLATQAQDAFHRLQLISMLWPEVGESEGRSRLSTTLTRLRQALPVWPLRAEGDTLRWDPEAGVSLDTLRFAELSQTADRASLGRAVALWRGPLLDGFALPGNYVYEEWLRGQRQAWERRILEVLGHLVHQEEKAGAWNAMADHCRLALSIDPLQERFHRWLMLAYYQAGDRAAALAQYSECCRVIERELATEPDTTTTALRDQILAGTLDRPSPGEGPQQPAAPFVAGQAVSPVAPAFVPEPTAAAAGPSHTSANNVAPVLRRQVEMVGRETVWARLAPRVEKARAGTGGIVTLEGPMGIGKSRLLRELAAAAARGGWRVLEVAPARAGEPYLPLSAALARISGGKADCSGLTQRGRPPVRSGEPWAAVVSELIAAAAQDPPLLLCIDNLEKAESVTAAGLLRLGFQTGRQSLLVVAALRTDEELDFTWHGFRAVGTAAGWLFPQELTGLDEADTRRLAAGVLGGLLPAPAARALHQVTGGNPLHIHHLLRAWVRMEKVEYGPDGWALGPGWEGEGPRDLHGAMVWRIQDLSPQVRDVLGLAAVLGRECDLSDLQALSGAGPAELTRWLRAAAEEQILTAVAGQRWRFTHPLLWAAAYEVVPPQTRRLAHGMAGHLLATTGHHGAAELAQHFDAAGLVGSAFAYHVQAGEAAVARHAHAIARDHFERAWQILQEGAVPLEEWWTRTALALSRASRSAGDPRAAAAVCREALRRRSALPPEEALRLQLELTESALGYGDHPAAARAHQEAATLAGDRVPEVERLRLRALGVVLRLHDHQAWELVLQEALELAALAQQAREDDLAGLLYDRAIMIMLQLQRPLNEVRTLAAQALSLLPLSSGPAAIDVRCHVAVMAAGRDEARLRLQEALEAALGMGEAPVALGILGRVAQLETATGDWRVARQYCEEAVRLATRSGSDSDRDHNMAHLGLVLAAMGESERGPALAAAAVEAAAARGDAPKAVTACGFLAQAQMAAGRPQAALAALAGVENWLSPGHVLMVEIRHLRVEALLRAGDLQAAAADFAALEAAERGGNPLPALEIMRVAIQGALARSLGRMEEALVCFAETRRLAGETVAGQWYLLWSLLEESRLWEKGGRVERATRCRREAEALAQRMGVPLLVQRLQRP